MAEPTLLPCPFCGEQKYLYIEYDQLCCRCQARGPQHFDRQANIAAWNRRAPVLPPAAEGIRPCGYLHAPTGQRCALDDGHLVWHRAASGAEWRDAPDAASLSARPTCVEAAMLGYVQYPRESHEKRIIHALRAAERAAGEGP